jgi:hypothetical protein
MIISNNELNNILRGGRLIDHANGTHRKQAQIKLILQRKRHLFNILPMQVVPPPHFQTINPKEEKIHTIHNKDKPLRLPLKLNTDIDGAEKNHHVVKAVVNVH